MPNDQLLQEIQGALALLNRPYWQEADFWIGIVFNLIGLALTGLAVWQAKKAREAAQEAGRTVKGQGVAIDLSEISQRIDSIEPAISFREARDLLAGINRKVRRAVAAFAGDEFLKPTVDELRSALDSAQESLRAVRPSDPDAEIKAPGAVYYGIENEFAAINNAIADLLGLLERQTIEGASDAH